MASGLAAWQSKWPRVWVISLNSLHTSHRIRFSGIFVFVFVITCRDESRWLSLSISETSDCQHGIFLVSFKIELFFRSHVTKETKKNGIFLISFLN